MDGLNFSSGGIRWRVGVVGKAGESFTAPQTGAGGCGLLFVADDGERRFLAVDPNAVPSLDALRARSNDELGRLANQAVIIAS